MNLSGTVLILAPHPDDEALGCGGLIARLCANGNPPHVVIMTGGGGSLRGHSNMPESEVVEARRKLSFSPVLEIPVELKLEEYTMSTVFLAVEEILRYF